MNLIDPRLHLLEECFRWFGPNDPVPLDYIRQAGATAVFSSLHQIPYGELWSREAIRERKDMLESAGLRWSVVESVPVHEDIKTCRGDLKKLFSNYTETLRHLAAEGISCVIYNFMPVLDWVRTDMRFGLPDASRLPTVDAGAGNLQILELEELEFLLSIVDAEFFPLIVLGAFQGIRPEEIAPKKDSPKPRLRWETIDWGFNSMVVPAEVSKTRKKVGRARKFPLHSVTRAWLETYGVEPTWRGEICKRNPGEVYRKKERLTTLWGRLLNERFPAKFPEWPQDSLRKSFASYRIATVRSTAQVSLEMGNSDEMLHRFYNNPRTLAEGEVWFEFLPTKAKMLAPYLDLSRLPKNSPNFEGSKQSNPSKARA